MKALNYKEINKTYLTFLLNFTILLVVTVVCYFLYLKADNVQTKMIVEEKKAHDVIFAQRQQFSNTIDTLNSYLTMLTTNQVENEVALERSILKLKNRAAKEIQALNAMGNTPYFILFDKIISDIEKTIDNKHKLQQSTADEEAQKKGLVECIEANKKVRNELIKRK